jgi:hypothetical protein
MGGGVRVGAGVSLEGKSVVVVVVSTAREVAAGSVLEVEELD